MIGPRVQIIIVTTGIDGSGYAQKVYFLSTHLVTP